MGAVGCKIHGMDIRESWGGSVLPARPGGRKRGKTKAERQDGVSPHLTPSSELLRQIQGLLASHLAPPGLCPLVLLSPLTHLTLLSMATLIWDMGTKIPIITQSIQIRI